MNQAAEATLERVPKSSQLKEWAYETLRAAIIDLRFRPGDSLREAALSERLGISKTPVREALGRLQADGLVELRPYRGAIVTGYELRDLEEIYELRELLEGSCARRAANEIDAQDMEELGEVVSQSEQALADGHLDELTPLFDRFDEILFRQTPNQRIQSQLDILRSHILRIGRLSVGIEGRVGKSAAEHSAIFEAISSRDPDRAELAMRRHIRNVFDDHRAALIDMVSVTTSGTD
jgi:DNA-binding GntR family transcriptional regulator